MKQGPLTQIFAKKTLYSSGNKFVVFCRVAASLQNTMNLFPPLYFQVLRIIYCQARVQVQGIFQISNKRPGPGA